MKGRQALLMQEKARKKALLIVERDRIAFEQYLSKERKRLLKRQVEMERNADDGGEAPKADKIVEVDMSGYETGSEGEIPEKPYLNVRSRNPSFLSRPDSVIYVRRRYKAPYKKLKTNKADNWAAERECLSLAFVKYHQESNGLQSSVFGEGSVDNHICCCNRRERTSERMITLVSLDKRELSCITSIGDTRGQLLMNRLFTEIKQSVEFCLNCSSNPVRLMKMGFLAATPVRPTIAFSLSMMQFLHTLCQETPLAIDSFAKALWRHHGQRDGSVKVRCYSSFFVL